MSNENSPANPLETIQTTQDIPSDGIVTDKPSTALDSTAGGDATGAVKSTGIAKPVGDGKEQKEPSLKIMVDLNLTVKLKVELDLDVHGTVHIGLL